MKLTAIGFLLCLICLWFLMIGTGTSLYAAGFWLFPAGVIMAAAGLFKKWK